MKMYVFDGTPEEISKVMRDIEPTVPGSVFPTPRAVEVPNEAKTKPPLPLGPRTTSADYEDKTFVTLDFARRCLTRLPLSVPLRNVLVALKDASPEWVSSANLYEASGYTGQQFAGLMGAFGRRMKHTEGYDEDHYFYDFDWDKKAEAWIYRLPETVQEAMRIEDIG